MFRYKSETDAYPECPDYYERLSQVFKPGDRVAVGPAYQSGGTYLDEYGCSGTFYVLRHIPTGEPDIHANDYYLARSPGGDWCFIVSASRIRPYLEIGL